VICLVLWRKLGGSLLGAFQVTLVYEEGGYLTELSDADLTLCFGFDEVEKAPPRLFFNFFCSFGRGR